MTRQGQGRQWAAALVASAAFWFCECAPTSIGIVSDVAPPSELLGENLDGPWAFSMAGSTYLALSGSSSCPTVPTELTALEANEILVEATRAAAILCTADLQTIVYELPVEWVPNYLTVIVGDE